MRDVVRISCFNENGRFGNQLFRYAFIKTYARRNLCRVEMPPWIGNRLFGAHDAAIDVRRALPVVRERAVHGIDDTVIPHARRRFINHDFIGWFQYHTTYYASHRAFIQSLFRPTREVQAHVAPLVEALRQTGDVRIGIHVRRGDYGRACFYRTPLAWYQRWLDEHWGRFRRPTLFVASDDPAVLDGFARFGARTAVDLGLARHEGDEALAMYADHHLLSHCEVLLIPNSTFSFTAAMLSRVLVEGWRSRLPPRNFARFDPWNDMPLLFADSVDAYGDPACDEPDVVVGAALPARRS